MRKVDMVLLSGFAPISPNQVINALWENHEYPDAPLFNWFNS
jgi:hypothetical protein